VHPAEPVPDEFVRSGEIRVVDLEPAALRRRLEQGLVFPKERADAALSNYFRYANLASLRELTQLWLDDDVDDPRGTFVARHRKRPAHIPQVVVVGLDASADDEWLTRYAAELAEVSSAKLIGVHVRGENSQSRKQAAQLEADNKLLEQLGATFREIRAHDVAVGLIGEAQNAGATQLVVGSRGRSRWSRLLRGSTVGEVIGLAGDLPVQVVNVGRSDKSVDGTDEEAVDSN
jgi:two-component system sensor histidine kinase KdpD